MNETLPDFIKLKDGTAYYKGPGELVMIIPEQFFERNHAIIEGDITHTIGIFTYAILKKPSDKIQDNVRRLNHPSAFSTKPGRIEKVKDFKLGKSIAPADYRLYYYADNDEDQLVCDINVPDDIANVEEFMSIFVSTAKMPRGIKYHDLYEYLEDSMKINGNSFKINMQEFGAMISELCIDPDTGKPFRLSKKCDTDPYAYEMRSIKEVANEISPFTAMISENWNKSVVSASLQDDKDIIDTPMEPILTGHLDEEVNYHLDEDEGWT